ncbi:hypothetical protein EZV62_006118 [Acer yangbiense]|uniref:Uncharacterized protein n=1 Tax=Acer yangbiense TaxID=1000413 RepID=A0A5C7IP98_9ROSI|nr:hypothetical protein EZV62_006118 [Acer yangbiense]
MENITTWFSDVGLLVGYLFNKVHNNPLLPSRTAVIDCDVYGVDDHNRARMRLLEEISKEEDDTTYFFTTRSVERVMNSCMLSFIMSVFAGNQLNLFIGSDENCNLIWSLGSLIDLEWNFSQVYLFRNIHSAAFALPAFLKREVSLLYDSPTQKQFSVFISGVPAETISQAPTTMKLGSLVGTWGFWANGKARDSGKMDTHIRRDYGYAKW